MIRHTAVSLAALALAAPALAQAQALPPTPIDPARLSQIDRALSTDAMEGRGPATAAEPKVIDYIVGQMKAAGLQPGGANGSWTQDVPLARFEVIGPVALSLTAGGKAQALTQGDQAVVQTLVPVNKVDISNAPLVFCGYGSEGAGARLGRLQGRRPARQDRRRAHQRPRLRGAHGRARDRQVRRQGRDLLRPLDLQVRGGCPPGRAWHADRARDWRRPPTAGTPSRTPTATRSSTSCATIPPSRTPCCRAGSSATPPSTCSRRLG